MATVIGDSHLNFLWPRFAAGRQLFRPSRSAVQGWGTRPHSRSSTRWTDEIEAAVDAPLQLWTRKAALRGEWRGIVKLASGPNMRTRSLLQERND